MVKITNILAVIPARGGSKGLPGKNMKNLCGKPLIFYSIKSSFESKYINKIVVSTDDDEIARVSEKLGAEVIVRPDELATDNSPTIETIIHTLNCLGNKNYKAEFVVLLQPTSPLRTVKDIDSAIELFINNKDILDSVISVSEYPHSPYWSLKIENGYLKPNFGDEFFKMRRQDLPKLYLPNGSVYVSSPHNIRKLNGFFGKKIFPYEMPMSRSIDIDNIIDFKLAEILMRGLK